MLHIPSPHNRSEFAEAFIAALSDRLTPYEHQICDVDLKPKTSIFDPDDAINHVYLLLGDDICATETLNNGDSKNIAFHFHQHGALIGFQQYLERRLQMKNGPSDSPDPLYRTSAIVLHGPGKALKIPVGVLNKIYDASFNNDEGDISSPHNSGKILEMRRLFLTYQLRMSADRFDQARTIFGKSIERRLAILFVHLSENFGEQTTRGILLKAFPLQLLAEYTGCRKATILTKTKILRDAGLVQVDSVEKGLNRYIIPDLQALKEYAFQIFEPKTNSPARRI